MMLQLGRTMFRSVSGFVVLALGLVSGVFTGSVAHAMPAEIVFLRHAEKPDSGNELSERGWDRARALPQAFATRSELTAFGAPVEVIGMAQKQGKSVRSIQTVSVLAQSLGLRLNTDYKKNNINELVQDIERDARLDGHTVVICWHRNNLPDLIEAFGGSNIGKVPKDQFDRFWVLRPTRSGMRVMDIPQNLLPGDSIR